MMGFMQNVLVVMLRDPKHHAQDSSEILSKKSKFPLSKNKSQELTLRLATSDYRYRRQGETSILFYTSYWLHLIGCRNLTSYCWFAWVRGFSLPPGINFESLGARQQL